MTVCQEMTGHGGWPLTVLLPPDKKPFFAGTYFPKSQKWGRPGTMENLSQIATMWQEDRQHILDSGDKITEAIPPHFRSLSKGELTKSRLKKGYDQYASTFDNVNRGFGNEQQSKLAAIAPAHADKAAVNGKTALYICENFPCQQPVTTLEEAEQKLN